MIMKRLVRGIKFEDIATAPRCELSSKETNPIVGSVNLVVGAFRRDACAGFGRQHLVNYAVEAARAGPWTLFGSYGNCTLAANLCPGHPPSGGGVEPAFFIGGRYHLNDKMALTVRLGFPSLSFGFSFFL